jgi:hypothetical protein
MPHIAKPAPMFISSSYTFQTNVQIKLVSLDCNSSAKKRNKQNNEIDTSSLE